MHRRLVELERDYDQLLAMQRQSFPINFPGRAFRPLSFDTALRSSVEYGEVYAYEVEGQLVGWLWLDWSDFGVGHIRHIQVARAHWGQGYGRAIMEDAIRIVAEAGREAVTLNVTKSNKRAMALYTSLGFAVMEDYGDRQYMRLDIGAQTAPVR